MSNFFQSLLSSSVPLSMGPVRTPFLQPTDLLSSVYIPSKGISRTNGGNPLQLTETTKIGTGLQASGFTPISYYRTPTGEFFLSLSQNLKSYNQSLNSNMDSYVNWGDDRQSDFKFSLREFVAFNPEKNNLQTSDGGIQDNPWTQKIDSSPVRLSNYNGTPNDNEDPVYFGFEIIINTQTSPLFNGELESFLNKIGSNYSELKSRIPIINQFKNEIFKYFKFSSSLNSSLFDPSSLIMNTTDYGSALGLKQGGFRDSEINNLRRYYVKKVAGLDKLVESNSPDARKSFVDYPKDKLTISFYEDTTLNLGTLASLYKLLYWSRIRGKSIIPENLLRFDCEIVISELRDFVSLQKSNNMLQYLKSNLTRYRYQLYECQFWFDKMSHPESIDMSESLTPTGVYDVQMNFKYSNMIFERYNPDSLGYTRLRNSTIDPLANFGGSPTSSNGVREYINRSLYDNNEPPIILGEYNSLSNGLTYSSTLAEPVADIPDPSASAYLNNLNSNQKSSIYGTIISPNSYGPYGSRGSNLYDGSQLIENLKNSALAQAQRGLDALLGNALNKIRNSFGFNGIEPPTNVYDNLPPSSLFFDVQNSLENFAGSVLTGLITGR